MGHPALRRPARKVPSDDIGSEALHRLVADMIDTLHDYGGIGLAAPQINESIRLAIVEVPGGPTRYGEHQPRPPDALRAPDVDTSVAIPNAIGSTPGRAPRRALAQRDALTVCVNPRIDVVDPVTEGYWEGCLSVPGLRGFVERPRGIRVTFTNLHGGEESLTASGFLSTVFQHEFDHLDGKLYVDHIRDTQKLVFEEEYARYVLPLAAEVPPK